MIYYNIINLWDDCRICSLSLNETSLCGTQLYSIFLKYVKYQSTDVNTTVQQCSTMNNLGINKLENVCTVWLCYLMMLSVAKMI